MSSVPDIDLSLPCLCFTCKKIVADGHYISHFQQTQWTLTNIISTNNKQTSRHSTDSLTHHSLTNWVKMHALILYCYIQSVLAFRHVGAKLIYLSRMYNDALFLKAWKSSSAHGFKAGVALVNTSVSDCIWEREWWLSYTLRDWLMRWRSLRETITTVTEHLELLQITFSFPSSSVAIATPPSQNEKTCDAPHSIMGCLSA